MLRRIPDGEAGSPGEFCDLDFITPQWSAGLIQVPDLKGDVTAVNPSMLRMAGEVADGVHVYPLGEVGYLAQVRGAECGCGSGDVGALGVRRRGDHELVRAGMSFYGSTPNDAYTGTRRGSRRRRLLREAMDDQRRGVWSWRRMTTSVSGKLLLRGTDDKGVYVLVVEDRFIHE